MNKATNWFFVTVLCGLVVLGCNKSESSGKDCSTGPNSAVAPSNGAVIYFVNLEGGGHITSVVYQLPSGPVTLANPIAPWQTTFFVDSGAVMSINAVGSGTTGLSAGYKFMSGNTNLIDSASCKP